MNNEHEQSLSAYIGHEVSSFKTRRGNSNHFHFPDEDHRYVLREHYMGDRSIFFVVKEQIIDNKPITWYNINDIVSFSLK